MPKVVLDRWGLNLMDVHKYSVKAGIPTYVYVMDYNPELGSSLSPWKLSPTPLPRRNFQILTTYFGDVIDDINRVGPKQNSYSNYVFDIRSVSPDDPILVEVIEQSTEGWLERPLYEACIRVVDVPDDMPWKIEVEEEWEWVVSEGTLTSFSTERIINLNTGEVQYDLDPTVPHHTVTIT